MVSAFVFEHPATLKTRADATSLPNSLDYSQSLQARSLHLIFEARRARHPTAGKPWQLAVDVGSVVAREAEVRDVADDDDEVVGSSESGSRRGRLAADRQRVDAATAAAVVGKLPMVTVPSHDIDFGASAECRGAGDSSWMQSRRDGSAFYPSSRANQPKLRHTKAGLRSRPSLCCSPDATLARYKSELLWSRPQE